MKIYNEVINFDHSLKQIKVKYWTDNDAEGFTITIDLFVNPETKRLPDDDEIKALIESCTPHWQLERRQAILSPEPENLNEGIYARFPKPVSVEKTFEEKVNIKLAQLAVRANVSRSLIYGGFSLYEAASWPVKREEAFLWKSNPDEANAAKIAPNLYLEKEARGISLTELADKVILKSKQFSILEARIAGYEGKLKDQIRNVPNGNSEALEAIDINNNWPN